MSAVGITLERTRVNVSACPIIARSGADDGAEMSSGQAEVDETFFRGRERNRHEKDRKRLGGWGHKGSPRIINQG